MTSDKPPNDDPATVASPPAPSSPAPLPPATLDYAPNPAGRPAAAPALAPAESYLSPARPGRPPRVATVGGCLAVAVPIAGMFACVLGIFWAVFAYQSSGTVDLRPEAGRPLLVERLGDVGLGDLSAEFRAAARVPASAGRADEWFGFQLDPEDVPSVEGRLRQACERNAARRTLTLLARATGTDNPGGADKPGAADARSADVPDWWRPQDLIDADTYEIGPSPGRRLVISRRTGQGYLLVRGR